MRPPFELSRSEFGLHSFMTPPLKLSTFILACDRTLRFVLIPSYTVSPGLQFFRTQVPLSTDLERVPQLRTVRRLTMDLLMTWPEFEAAVAEFEGDGSPGAGSLRFWQMTREPTRRYDFDRLKPETKVPVYRNQGVVLFLELPHNLEVGMVSAADEEPIRLARDRLLAARARE
jgi:hypothetical protein